MSNALLSDVEARAERRRLQTRKDLLNELAQRDWRRAQAATTPASRRRWLERAHRLLPRDELITAALASALLDANEYRPAAALFRTLADRHNVAEVWAGLATSLYKLVELEAARAATAALIRASVLTPTLRTLAEAVAGPAGWCALRPDGTIHASRTPTAIRIDGKPLKPTARILPKTWRTADHIEILGPNGPMLGSPIPLRPFATLDGFVAAGPDGDLLGWAWQPTNPDLDPTLHISGPNGARTILLTDPMEDLHLDRPFARPRRFILSPADTQTLGEPLAITGSDGRHLLGSPISPALLTRPNSRFTAIWAETSASLQPAAARSPNANSPAPVDVIVPVYRGATETLACLDSVLASLPCTARLIVVDDASPYRTLAAALDKFAATRRITLIRLAENVGFPAAANAGLRASPGRDAVLLNSDTLVPPGWLDRLRAAAYAAPDIGTVTPFTNDGTILGYPDPGAPNAIPDLAETIALDALAQKANPGARIEIPVGVGFCLYLRRDCLDQVGLLREDLFAQGYGEENDLCLRARHNGWRNVAALDVFVAHLGATSFGPARTHLIARNTAILNRLHPGYDALVQRHLIADPLRPARARIDSLRWAEYRSRTGAFIAITHAGGGGVDRVVTERLAAAEARGLRPIIVRPHRLPGGANAVRIEHSGGPATPNLVFPMPDCLSALAKFLRPDRPRTVELHHLLGHHHAIAGLAALLKAEAVSIVHDYARFCPRIALVSTERRYCGEPDIAGCEACIADLGSLLEDDPAIPELLARSAAELGAASRIVVPSADTAARIARHFPGTATPAKISVEPWDNDSQLPGPLAWPRQDRLRIAIVGAIGTEKGYDLLLACARDAAARNLPLDFVVVGYTSDDERLLAAGPVFITGEYDDRDAIPLIRAQRAQAAFIPSVWPETWCFALTRVWEAGLPAFVFDIGAPAERLRATGRGWLLPFGLSPRATNDALLRLAP